MKKSDKKLLSEAFDKFCQLKHYYVDKDSAKQLYLDQYPNEHDFYQQEKREEYLFQSRMNKSYLLNHVFEFAQYMLEDNAYKHLACLFLIEKSPSKTHSEHFNLTMQYLNFLSKHHEQLLDYTMRPNFLKQNIDYLQVFFEKPFFSQEEKYTMIELYVNDSSMDDLNYKRKIYNIVQQYIDHKEDFNHYFKDFNNIEEDKNLILHARAQQIYSIIVDINELVKMSPVCTKANLYQYIAKVPQLEQFYDQLEVKKIIYNTSSNQIIDFNSPKSELVELSWLGDKINTQLITKFTNNYLRLMLMNEEARDNFNSNPLNNTKNTIFNDLIEICIKEAKITVLKEKIETIAPLCATNIKTNKLKI